MTDTWKGVWSRKRPDPARGSLMAQLMAADGFDTGFGSVDEAHWRAYIGRTACELGIGPGTSVFEVGCGAGAFLYELYGMGCAVAGLDHSASLVTAARAIMPLGQFEVADALALDATEMYDVVIASGVFLYFPSLDYARGVVERMARKARRAVAILDVPDLAKQDEAIAMRRGTLGAQEYDRRYVGLDHLYFDRTSFTPTLDACGFTDVRVEGQAIAGYANGAHRFNVFAFRPGTQPDDPHAV